MNKKNISSNIINNLNTISQHTKHLLDLNISNNFERFFFSNKLTKKLLYGVYYPKDKEVDTLPIMTFLCSKNYNLALPKITNYCGIMNFTSFDINEPLQTNKIGIKECISNNIVFPQMIITPMISFDLKGNRIGYGKGFYDRYFQQNPSTVSIGIAYDLQETSFIESEEHDVPMDILITNSRILVINNKYIDKIS